ncbi:MAG: division/cell wall cluster transcriptional repressor MraZ [Sphingomonadaceae bacterium]
MFLGVFQHTIDDKGRLAIPAKFRPSVAGGFVMTFGLDRCLYIWPRDEWSGLAEKLAKLPMMNPDARRVARHFFAGAVETDIDKLGRVVIPQPLRDYAGLKGEVVVAGMPNRLEVWSQESWDAERAMVAENSSAFAEHLANAGISF